MAHIAFDTLKFVERLVGAGLPPPQAKAIMEAQAEAFAEATDTSLATKADIQDLKLELRDLKADNKLIKWMLGFLLAGVASLMIKLLV